MFSTLASVFASAQRFFTRDGKYTRIRSGDDQDPRPDSIDHVSVPTYEMPRRRFSNLSVIVEVEEE